MIITQLNAWTVRMEMRLKKTATRLSLEELQQKSDLLLSGIKIARAIRNEIWTLLNLHSSLEIAITR